jgi:hypothetical protein
MGRMDFLHSTGRKAVKAPVIAQRRGRWQFGLLQCFGFSIHGSPCRVKWQRSLEAVVSPFSWLNHAKSFMAGVDSFWKNRRFTL